MKAWLYRVTSNLCFNLVRDRKRRAAILETVPRPTSDEARQADIVFHGEQQGQILAAMERLSENHRKILMLRYYGDLSYAEIQRHPGDQARHRDEPPEPGEGTAHGSPGRRRGFRGMIDRLL